MKDFTNKVIVVTGAGSGIGRATAIAFARRGAQVAMCDRDEKGLEQTAQAILSQSSKKPLISAFDISDKEAVLAFSQNVQNALGGAHVLINNAGIEGSAKPVWATDEDIFRRVMEVNYFAVVNMTKAFLSQIQSNLSLIHI